MSQYDTDVLDRSMSRKEIAAFFKDDWFKNSWRREWFLEDVKLRYIPKNDLLVALSTPASITNDRSSQATSFWVEELEHKVRAISIRSGLTNPFETAIGNHVLYERFWYEQLLESILARTVRGCALIGSAGTSKSTYQFWVIYRMLQAVHNSKDDCDYIVFVMLSVNVVAL